MNDEQHFLANAYVDGEVTADERGIAEADPEVMTEVERLRELQTMMRDVPVPSDAARDGAISAAMAEFGRRDATAPAPAVAPAIPFRPRPAYARLLGVAAALIAVVGLGVVVSRASLGGSEDDSAAEPAATNVAAVPADDQTTLAPSAADEGQAEMVTEAAEAMSTEESGDEAVAEDAADDAAADGGEEPGSDVAAADSAGALARVVVPPGFDPEAPVADEFDLGNLAAYLLDQRDAGTLPPTPNTPCSDVPEYEILDRAIALIDDELTSVYIAVDETSGTAVALDSASCEEVAMGSVLQN